MEETEGKFSRPNMNYVPIRPHPSRMERAKMIFFNTSILCGTAVVLAVTVKVILSLFM